MEKIRLSKLDEISKTSAPYEINAMLIIPTGLIMFTQLSLMAGCGLYTPGHTNSFSIIAMTLSQNLMIIGCGGLTGLSYAKYSVLPSASRTLKPASN